MDLIFLFLFCIFLAARDSSTTNNAGDPATNLQSVGLPITITQKVSDGVESSIFIFRGITYAAFTTTGLDVHIKNTRTGSVNDLPFPARFFYFLVHKETVYIFYQSNGSIFAQSSVDLMSWKPVNSGAPVLTQEQNPQSIYHQLFNPAVQVDSTGVWHMVLECNDSAPDQQHVGLAYMRARMGPRGELDFNADKKPAHVIPGGGNPELKVLDGQGLVAVHGQIYDQFLGFWYMTVSAFDGKRWVRNKNMTIGQAGIHVCDPSIIEEANTLRLFFSFDQKWIYVTQLNTNYQELFHRSFQ